MAPQSWPVWWAWELEISTHALKRMVDRDFNEVDLRRMLEDAAGWRVDVDDHVDQRFVIETRHRGQSWEVIVEPILEERVLLVITAFSVTS